MFLSNRKRTLNLLIFKGFNSYPNLLTRSTLILNFNKIKNKLFLNKVEPVK